MPTGVPWITGVLWYSGSRPEEILDQEWDDTRGQRSLHFTPETSSVKKIRIIGPSRKRVLDPRRTWVNSYNRPETHPPSRESPTVPEIRNQSHGTLGSIKETVLRRDLKKRDP